MTSPSFHPAAAQPKLLPVVRRVIQQLDLLYVNYAQVSNAVAHHRLEEVYGQWLAAGRTGPSGLRFYVQALEEALTENTSRAAFVEQAEEVLVHLQSGYAH